MHRSESSVQLDMFSMIGTDHVVNVASVPKRSPFRYPGGKTWLVPRVRQWLAHRQCKPSFLVEPFAGGGIIGLTCAFERLVEHVLLVELDTQVAAVWQTILGGEAEWLVERILNFQMSIDTVRAVLAGECGDTREQAFRTILKNRTFHGGILAPGASLIRHGENGKGLLSRWYAATLAKRITDIARIRDRITFVCGDGIGVIEAHSGLKDAVFFIDPPYTAGGASGKRAGNRLYVHHQLDHELLFAQAAKVSGDFLMTYDNAADVCALADRHGLDTQPISMKNTHHTTMNELLIGRDLGWVR